jgi:hypothetical protein
MGRKIRHAGSFGAVVVAAHEVAKRDADRSCQRRQDPLVVRFAGLEALDCVPPNTPAALASSLTL